MSREIKFRGWDGEKRRMWSWRELVDTHPLGCLYSHGDGSWEVMQYTGFLDRNRTPIYEGDIVRVTNGADEVDERNSDTGIGVVEWLNNCGIWSVSTIENGLGDLLDFSYIEVIGNIYENPALMQTDGEQV